MIVTRMYKFTMITTIVLVSMTATAFLRETNYTMRSTQLIKALASFAALALAVPFEDKEHHVQVFKRGEPLTPRDLELAEIHEVNTTESMYMHLHFASHFAAVKSST